MIHIGEEALYEALIAHQRKDSASCTCGWAELGKSHLAHVVDQVKAAQQR